jgi:5-methylcytosine-specific restriction protein A
MIAQLSSGQEVVVAWPCGRSTAPKAGDRAFWLRQGKPPRGIFASGTLVEDAHSEPHHDPAKAARGRTQCWLRARLDRLLDSDAGDVLQRAALDAPGLSAMHWDTRISGVRIPDEVAAQLERVWGEFTAAE